MSAVSLTNPQQCRRPGTYVRTDEHRAAAAVRAREQIKGWKNEGHPFWKGEDASYASKHEWAGRQWGKPSRCEHCAAEDRKSYDWANISGEYRREREDWLRLCRPCHQKFDRRRRPSERWVEFRGERRSLKEWSEVFGINYQRLYQRVHRLGWPIEQALTLGRYAR